LGVGARGRDEIAKKLYPVAIALGIAGALASTTAVDVHSKLPAIIFLALGFAFIACNKLVIAGIHWLDKSIWNQERRRRFPGLGGDRYEPWMSVVLGAFWIACGIFFWFTSK